MATINMHMKFEIEIPKQTWLMLRKPCRLQTDGRTNRRTDKVNPVYPPPTSLGEGITIIVIDQEFIFSQIFNNDNNNNDNNNDDNNNTTNTKIIDINWIKLILIWTAFPNIPSFFFWW